jgi:xanthine dehydrogenase accessory factor
LATGEVSLHDGVGCAELALDDAAVTKVFGPAWHLLLIGDGQLARTLARMARMLDYRVTICDPRETFADPDPLPDVHYTRQMPDDAVRCLADDPRSAVVTLAHDPRQDDLGLIEALPSRAFYVGALGSRRSAASRAERLAAMGLSPAQIDRLDAPAGIDIGSKRPAEIALSILAGLTAVRNGTGRVESRVPGMRPIVGLLLAAGSARRFGADKLMAALPDGRMVGQAAALALRPGVDRAIAIVRPGTRRLGCRA